MLNNIVVENLSSEFGQELKKAFEDLGIDTGGLGFNCHKKDKDDERYYGIINDVFSFYFIGKVQQSNAKIITLEELKAMKKQYPRQMYVSDEPIINYNNEVCKAKVCFEKEFEGHTYYFIKECYSFVSYKYAVELDHFEKQIKEITIEEIAQRFGYPIEQIRIKK